MPRELVFCDLVKVHSLQGMKVLNGSIGIVMGVAPTEQNPDGDRYEIHIKNQDHTLMIRKTNLTPLFDTYRVADSKKAEGKGVFALRDIEAGEVIMREKSLLRIPEDKLRVEDPTKPDMKVAGQYAKSELSPGDYALFSKLVGDNDGEKVLRNVFEPQAGMLFVAEMMNHSCTPSANYEYDEDQNCEVIYAIRDIKAGEEIFISYVSLGLDFPRREQRQQELLATKRFECRCELCSHSQSDLVDIIFKELSSLEEEMYSFLKLDSYSPKVDITTNRMIEIASKFFSSENDHHHHCDDDKKNHDDNADIFPSVRIPMMKIVLPLFAEQAFRIAVRFQNSEKVTEWATKYIKFFVGTHPSSKYWTSKINLMTSYVKNPSASWKKK